MSDLIERLRLTASYSNTMRQDWTREMLEAATALAEAAATISRQQVMLDRALEASFDDKARADRAEAEIVRLRAVLEIVAAGPILGEPMARWINHMMAKALAALSGPHATKGDEG